jgi:hypothetical protein
MTISGSVESVRVESFGFSVTAAPVPRPSSTDRRADRLMTALDADGDGSVTAGEFSDGAMSLLRRAGAQHRAERHHDRRDESRRLGRFERTLERAFERVDANDDGAIDAQEMTAALGGIRRGGYGRHDREEAASSAPTAAPDVRPASGGATVTTVQFTFVAIAIQRYSSVQATAGPGGAVPEGGSSIVPSPADPVARPDESAPTIVPAPVPRPVDAAA